MNCKLYLAKILLLFLTALACVVPASDDQVASVGGSPAAGKIYDLYITSLCPRGIPALAELAEVARGFPHREWNVWFIGTAEGDRLLSPRGAEEVFDETLWLGVKELYPFRYHEFLFLKTTSQTPTEELLDEMGLDAGKIRHWAEEAGASELRRHYARSARLNVSVSPTLFVNGAEFKKTITGGRLISEECAAANPQPAFCAEYPECYDDTDCEQKGKLGRCAKADEGGSARAVCEYRDDAVFTLTVLTADTAYDAPEREFVEIVAEAMPGARIAVVKLSSAEGQAVMARYTPGALPFFHFEKAVEGAFRFAEIKDALIPAGRQDGVLPASGNNTDIASGNDGFTLKAGVVRTNYFPKREEKPGQAVLYADPLMPNIGRVITALLSDTVLSRRVALMPLAPPRDLRDNGQAPVSLQEKLRAEEAARWLVLSSDFPKKYHAYLNRYANDPITSYWFNWLKPIGVNQKKFLRAVEAGQSKVALYRDSLPRALPGEQVVIMFNNRLKVVAAGERELEEVLKLIRGME